MKEESKTPFICHWEERVHSDSWLIVCTHLSKPPIHAGLLGAELYTSQNHIVEPNPPVYFRMSLDLETGSLKR